MKKIGRPLLKKRTIQRTKILKKTKTLWKKETENKGGEEKKKIRKKDKESKNKGKEGKNKFKGNNSPREKSKIYILVDSMIKKLNGYFITKKVRHKYLIKVRSFSDAKVSFMVNHVNPTLRDDKPDHIIFTRRYKWSPYRENSKPNCKIYHGLNNIIKKLWQFGNCVWHRNSFW